MDLEAMDLKCPRKLDFNTPLLSTKRLNPIVTDTSCSSNASERVPFSWEEAAGKPKDAERGEEETPRLRLPPCKWHAPKEPDEVDEDDNLAAHDQVSSDAMEVFSLSEALDIVQKSEEARSESHETLRLKLAEDSNNGYLSPNYLIKRFLPDATALALSSSLHFSNTIDDKICHSCGYVEAPSPKGCGLEILFPWRMKHKLCAMKSPILPCSTNVHKHKDSSKQKKKKHQGSSAHKCCTNVKIVDE